MNYEEPLTSTTRPKTQAIITVRIIKSFPYRNVKNHVIHDIDLTTTTVKQLKEKLITEINTQGQFRPYRNVQYNTIKLYNQAHHTKTMNLVINMDHDDELILRDDSKTLDECGVENETELSFFNMDAYLEYKNDPEEKW